MLMLTAKYKQQKGFTIVELLIVIVVIGILAAITIVSYNGIRERAESTAIVARAQAYIKGLKLWEADLGRPTTASCIAPSSYATCPTVQSWGSNIVNDATFNGQLATYSGISSPALGSYGPNNPNGLMFYHSNWYGMNRGVLGYWIGPNSDCTLDNLLQSDHKTPAAAGTKYTLRTTAFTQCEVEVFKY